jgi:hypothetical protein
MQGLTVRVLLYQTMGRRELIFNPTALLFTGPNNIVYLAEIEKVFDK